MAVILAVVGFIPAFRAADRRDRADLVRDRDADWVVPKHRRSELHRGGHHRQPDAHGGIGLPGALVDRKAESRDAFRIYAAVAGGAIIGGVATTLLGVMAAWLRSAFLAVISAFFIIDSGAGDAT